jgi:hypothetical protein
VWGFRFAAHYRHAQAVRQLRRLKGLMRDHGEAVSLLAAHDQFSYRHIFGRPL